MGRTAPRAHILVVNDTQAILDLMRDLLEGEGYQVSVSIVTLELARIKALQPDLIVQDLLFAGTQEMGWDFLSLVRLDPGLARIPVVLCTGAAETITNPATAQKLDRLGVRVVLKPFDVEELLTTVAEVVTAQKLLDQAREA